MVEDPEKRLQRALDKLYHAPKPKSQPSFPSGERAEMDARRHPAASLAKGAASFGMTKPCRPWDRGDLMRRLSTFKAMSWFGKPKSISPVNCARRGWINAEMDVIVCEACEARLLFSTPSSWTYQQVEKAAAVFSLKLDNGHKLLCPWINNACDESLALFPPSPSENLVEAYSGRALRLLKLSALPIISSAAIEYMKMKSPQLESFLSQSSHPVINIQNGIKLIKVSKSKDMENSFGNDTTNLYYQALKLLSLCGWELRLLPYVVNCEDQSVSQAESASTSESLQLLHKKKSSFSVYSSSSTVQDEGAEHLEPKVGDGHYDPSSAVLDCRFCGACVALWTMATVQCPLEFFKVVADSNKQNETATSPGDLATGVEASGADSLNLEIQDSVKGADGSSHHLSTKKRSGLNLTIAGGPPPTRQNFRPTVSFPVISRHLKPELNYCKMNFSCENSSRNQVSGQTFHQSGEPSGDQSDKPGNYVISHSPVTFKRKKSENEFVASKISDLNGECQTEGEFLCDEASSKSNAPMEGGNFTLQEGTPICRNNYDGQEDITEVMFEKEKSVNGEGEAFKILSSGGFPTPQTNSKQSDMPTDVEMDSKQSDMPNDVEMNSKQSDMPTDVENFKRIKESNIYNTGLEHILSPSITTEAPEHVLGEGSKQLQNGTTNGLDVIKHHRPYCPWIYPDDAETLPGWRLTLSSVHQKSDSNTSLKEENISSFLNEMDDPLVSVRKLFMSPSPKRLKRKP